MTETKKILLVYSTSHTLRLEKMLKGRDVTCKLVPVPRHLSSDCGICLRFRADDEGAVTEAVADSGIETAGIFAL